MTHKIGISQATTILNQQLKTVIDLAIFKLQVIGHKNIYNSKYNQNGIVDVCLHHILESIFYETQKERAASFYKHRLE